MPTPTSIPNRTIKRDRVLLRALSFLADYAPRNHAYSIEALRALEDEVVEALDAVAYALITLRAARNRLRTAAWRFHQALLGAKAEVITQYGPDSLAVESVGLTRSSERKRPQRRARAAAD